MIRLVHRIILTELCNQSCPHCFNADFRTKGVMDADMWIKFIQDNTDYIRGHELKVMGGEPTLHPRFLEVVEESLNHYRTISIFTNGSTMHKYASNRMLMKNHFRGRVDYKINGYVFDPNKFEEYKEYVHQIGLHCVVPLGDSDLFVNKVLEFTYLHPQVMILLSPDTQVNIFDESILKEYREVWINVITDIVPELRRMNIPFGYDHVFPICFYTQEMIDILHTFDMDSLYREKICCCGDLNLGLIDYNFDLYYCNQTRIKLGSILKDDNTFKTMDEIFNMIQCASSMKTESILELSDKCRSCHVVASCKTGCFYNSLVGGLMCQR